MDNKRIHLVDDHSVVTSGLKQLIEKLGPYSIEKEFNSGIDFLNFLKNNTPPDLVILDLSMAKMGGEEVVEKLKENYVKFPILILTLNEDKRVISRLFQLGIQGYLKKDCSAEDLKNAMESIFRGKGSLYQNEFLLGALQNPTSIGSETPQEKILSQCSKRELEFLKWVMHEDDLTYKAIAEEMCVSERTVDGYRESIFQKFDIKSKAGLVGFVFKNQLNQALIEYEV